MHVIRGAGRAHQVDSSRKADAGTYKASVSLILPVVYDPAYPVGQEGHERPDGAEHQTGSASLPCRCYPTLGRSHADELAELGWTRTLGHSNFQIRQGYRRSISAHSRYMPPARCQTTTSGDVSCRPCRPCRRPCGSPSHANPAAGHAYSSPCSQRQWGLTGGARLASAPHPLPRRREPSSSRLICHRAAVKRQTAHANAGIRILLCRSSAAVGRRGMQRSPQLSFHAWRRAQDVKIGRVRQADRL